MAVATFVQEGNSIDYLKKVAPGQPLKIPAAAYNAFVEAAEESARRRISQLQDAVAGHRFSGLIRVKNASGAARSRFDVLALTVPLILPTEDLAQFKNRIVLSGTTPDADHADAFAVLQEPLAAGSIGWALAAGVSVVQVQVTDASHQYAQAKAGDATQLESADSGIARILWKPSATGTQWTVARLAGGGGGGGVAIRYAKPNATPAGTATIIACTDCSAAGAATGLGTVNIAVCGPVTGGSTAGIRIVQGEVYPYLPTAAGTLFNGLAVYGVFLPINLIRGSASYQVMQWNGSTWIADYPRGHA